jgi:hypothetical protein
VPCGLVWANHSPHALGGGLDCLNCANGKCAACGNVAPCELCAHLYKPTECASLGCRHWRDRLTSSQGWSSHD